MAENNHDLYLLSPFSGSAGKNPVSQKFPPAAEHFSGICITAVWLICPDGFLFNRKFYQNLLLIKKYYINKLEDLLDYDKKDYRN